MSTNPNRGLKIYDTKRNKLEDTGTELQLYITCYECLSDIIVILKYHGPVQRELFKNTIKPSDFYCNQCEYEREEDREGH